ncbi:hypothetical protein NIES2109_17290 [Nostoc sp. HK-01]|nr:hypothetical protein NIES2109_17290 [Nostoc sp. HK-01]
MLNAIPLIRLCQLTTTVAVSFAMLAAIKLDSAQAFSLTTFKISGNFAPVADNSSIGLPVSLANGSFNGTYTVDADQLPSSDFVNLTSWTINLVSNNTVLQTLSNTLAGNTAYIQENILAFTDAGLLTGNNQNMYSLELYFNRNFTGVGSTKNGIFLDNSDLGNVPTFGGNQITFAKSQPVPEPQNFGGIGVVIAMGLWLKNKQKKLQK